MMPQLQYKAGGVAVLGDGGGDGWIIQGLGSTYGLDQGFDRVQPGAYRDSLQERPNVPLLWAHNPEELIGKTLFMTETSEGLYFKGQISPTRRGTDAAALMRSGSLSGVSIGYSIARSSYQQENGKRVRLLHAINLHELSLTPFPMNLGARATLSAGKSAWARALTIAEYEAIRDTKGLWAIPKRLHAAYNRAIHHDVCYQAQQARRALDVERLVAEIDAELRALGA